MTRVVVTGSAGHLGEALLRTFSELPGYETVGIDILASEFTTNQASITDSDAVLDLVAGADAVLHTATLHKPHVATHSRQDFVDVNISGTLNLLEAARQHRVPRFVFTSTTSTFGHAMRPAADAPAVWIDETVRPQPRNIYGVTKVSAEDLCELFHKRFQMPVMVLKTSRFFPEEDDNAATRAAFDDANIKAIEYLYRRVELADVVSAHQCAMQAAEQVGFGRFIVSSTSPFDQADLALLNQDAAAVLRARLPEAVAGFARLGWRLPERIDRVYDNTAARQTLGWEPQFDFRSILDAHLQGTQVGSALSQRIGSRGYHEEKFIDGPFPVEE